MLCSLLCEYLRKTKANVLDISLKLVYFYFFFLIFFLILFFEWVSTPLLKSAEVITEVIIA